MFCTYTEVGSHTSKKQVLSSADIFSSPRKQMIFILPDASVFRYLEPLSFQWGRHSAVDGDSVESAVQLDSSTGGRWEQTRSKESAFK